MERHSVAQPSTDPSERLLLGQNTQTYKDANKKLVFVPLVFIIARIWGTMRFILDLSNAKLAAAWLAPLQVSGESESESEACIALYNCCIVKQ